jgi:hypothetical protein
METLNEVIGSSSSDLYPQVRIAGCSTARMCVTEMTDMHLFIDANDDDDTGK